MPFKAKSLEALHALIMKDKLEFVKPISEPAEELIRRMLKIEPEERISIPSILQHPWLKTEEDLEVDDDHDFEMGISFRREECNFNPLSMIGRNEAMAQPPSSRHKVNNPETEADTVVEPTEES